MPDKNIANVFCTKNEKGTHDWNYTRTAGVVLEKLYRANEEKLSPIAELIGCNVGTLSDYVRRMERKGLFRPQENIEEAEETRSGITGKKMLDMVKRHTCPQCGSALEIKKTLRRGTSMVVELTCTNCSAVYDIRYVLHDYVIVEWGKGHRIPHPKDLQKAERNRGQ